MRAAIKLHDAKGSDARKPGKKRKKNLKSQLSRGLTTYDLSTVITSSVIMRSRSTGLSTHIYDELFSSTAVIAIARRPALPGNISRLLRTMGFALDLFALIRAQRHL
jgi:hypothetical protein